MQILNLHTHSEFSNVSCGFKDSSNKLFELLDFAYDNGHAGIGLTDHESVTSHVRAMRWWKDKIESAETEEEKEKAKNFKVIMGNEIYIAREGLTKDNFEKGENFFHFILLAKDSKGQKQLRELSSMAWERSFMQTVMRRFNYISDLQEIIGKDPGHVVATTACISNIAGNAFLNMPNEDALKTTQSYLELMSGIFGEENFFVELAPSLYTEQIEYNKFMYNNFKDSYNFVITNDVHYLTKEDYRTLELLLAAERREADKFYKYSHFMTWEEIVESMNYLPLEFLEKSAQNALDIGKNAKFYDLHHNQIIPEVPREEIELSSDIIESVKDYEYILKYINSEYESDRVLIQKVLTSIFEKETGDRLEKSLDRINKEMIELWGISKVQGSRLSNYLLTMAWIIEVIWDAGSMVGPGRGSAVAFLTNYHLGITTVNPIDYPLYIPYWRFLSSERPELPDIDIDIPGSDRALVLNALEEAFVDLGGEVVQVQTYGTESGKKAIRTIGRGLGISTETLDYITSMIPSERGTPLTISQCYYGDDDHKPIQSFVEQMDENQELLEQSLKIEGLIGQMGTHAGGVIFSNNKISDLNSIMKTKRGVRVTAYDLHESEDTGLIKYDILSVDAVGKLKTATYLLLEHDRIEWQGSFRETFNKYFKPSVLDPSPEVWENISSGHINSLFQLSTPVGQSAVKLLKVKSIEEMGMANSLMRLQTESDKQPLDIFAEYREDISKWYDEMKNHGLNEKDIEIMEDHLLKLNGVSDTQESMMLMAMDERISGFSVAEANALRKAVARKNPKAQAEVRNLFYTKGKKLGTSKQLLDYVWNVQIFYQLGYGFSIPHVAAYSYMGLQEAVIYTDYPEIYWNTACLIDDAGAFSEEDFPNLIERGILEATDEYYEVMGADDISDMKIKTTPIDRDKIATSIAMFQETMTIEAPDVNKSGFGFTMDEETNTVQAGLKIVSKLGNKFIYDIIRNRPYISFDDFLENTNISRDRIVMLIKADAFRNVDNRDRMTLLKDYVRSISEPKKVLNGRNINMLITMGLLPKELIKEQRNFMWWKHVSKFKDKAGYVKLDAPGLAYFTKNYDDSKLEYFETGTYLPRAYGKSLVDKTNEKIKDFIKKNHDELLEKVNENLYNEMWEKYSMRSLEEGEMQSMRMYTGKHPLKKYNLTYDKIEDIKEDHYVGMFNIRGKRFPEHYIYHIVGTVVAKDKMKNTVTLLTPEGAIILKIWKDVYNHFDRKVTTVIDGRQVIIQDSFFEVGTHLAVFGRKSEDIFFPKIYKKTGVPSEIVKLNPVDGKIETELKISEDSDD